MSASPARQAPTEDAELLAGLAEAKPEAFHRFYEAWFPRVYAYAQHVLGSRPHAEAVTSRTLHAALSSLPEPGTPIAPWLFARLRREIANARRPTMP
jgi:DNA-directed RNA polymerase specialized sigma24 family protein